MPRKLTYGFVKEQFESEGYTLLSKNYKNNKIKLGCICPEGHICSISWNKWQQGRRCPYCYGNIKLTIEQIKYSFEKETYTLLTTDYTNNKHKIKYRCSNGHEHSIKWNDWQQGARCPYCYGNVKHSFEEIKNAFEKEDHILLSDGYKGAHYKLYCICPQGHKFYMTWHNWRHGHRCPTCSIINNSGENHYNWQGGKSFEEYCAIWKDQEYKQDIRERDGNNCLNPCCSSKNPNDLTIHHIDYDKQNCHPSNLITVCRSCNSRANKDRRWHKAWYQAIIKNRYKEAIYV